MFAPLQGPVQRRAVSLRGLLLVALAVVLAHAVFLRHVRLGVSSAEGRARSPVAVLQVRALNAPVQTAPPAALPGPTAVDTMPLAAARAAARKPVRAVADPADVAPPGTQAMPADGTPASSPPVLVLDLDVAAAAVSETTRFAEPIPTYPTSIPQAFTQVYELRRGALIGRAELHWRPAGDAYEARLSASLGDPRWLEWVSRGGFDAAGIAPLRFTDQRRGRAAQAANFQRSGSGEGATISYSGPAVRHPLHAGAQDRLSWIVQLSAIAQGRGVALSGGTSIAMFVSGARGDGDVWVFTSAGTEMIEAAGGPVEAVKLVREPRRPYDTLAEVWLDPAREHRPARLRLSTLPRGDSLDFVLLETSTARP